MKTYTFVIEVVEGMDEFWDANPSDQDVYDLLEDEILKTHIDYRSLKLIKVVNEAAHGIIDKNSKE